MTAFEKKPRSRRSFFLRGDPVLLAASTSGAPKSLRFGFATEDAQSPSDAITVYTHLGTALVHFEELRHFDGEVDLRDFPHERFVPDRRTTLLDGTETLWNRRGRPIISVRNGIYVFPCPRALVGPIEDLEILGAGSKTRYLPEEVRRGRILRARFGLPSRSWPGFEASYELYRLWDRRESGALSQLISAADSERSPQTENDRAWGAAVQGARGSEIGICW